MSTLQQSNHPPLGKPPPPSSIHHANSNSVASKATARVIMHVDMDCFYAQVERERFPHFRHQPLAVVQNGTLCVTTNYRVRLQGLPKTGRPAELVALCPHTRFVGSDMKRYRFASRQWHRIFLSFGCPVMKRGIDEAYIDLTKLTRERIKNGHIKKLTPHPNPISIKTNAEQRFKKATEKWLVEEKALLEQLGPIDQSLLESSGTLHAAIRVSESTDPITKLRKQQAQLHSGQLPVYGKANDREKVRIVKPEFLGKSLEEIEAACNLVHPIDFCRSQFGELSASTLVPFDPTINTIGTERMWVGNILRGPGITKSSETPSISTSTQIDESSLSESSFPQSSLPMKRIENDSSLDSSNGFFETDDDLLNTNTIEEDWDESVFDISHVVSFATMPLMSFQHEDPDNPSDDYLICIGSQIAYEMRCKVFEELGFTTSAGIASNPMLAKLASSKHKPNQQSLVRPSETREFISQFPLKAINGFGPKAQEHTAALGVTQVSEVQFISKSNLISKFGLDLGSWLYNIGQGIDHSAVEVTGPPKSIGQSKRQKTKSDKERIELLCWLAENLYLRIEEDEHEYHRRPSTLILSWIPFGSSSWTGISRRTTIPYFGHLPNPVKQMYTIALAMLKEYIPSTAVLMCLSLGVSSFVPLTSTTSISTYFSKYFPKASALETGIQDSELISASPKNEDLEHNVQSSVEPAVTNKVGVTSKKASIHMFIQKVSEVKPEFVTSSSSAPIDGPKSTDDDTFQCEECKSIILIKQRQIHIDHHFAMKLQSELRNEDRQRREEEALGQLPPRKPVGNKKSVTSKPPNSNTLLSLWSKSPPSK